MGRTRCVDDVINSSFGEVIDTYRKQCKRAFEHHNIVRVKELKQDFYTFKEVYPERMIDYFWVFIAQGKFDTGLLKE
jgi:hypothetical protein